MPDGCVCLPPLGPTLLSTLTAQGFSVPLLEEAGLIACGGEGFMTAQSNASTAQNEMYFDRFRYVDSPSDGIYHRFFTYQDCLQR